MNGIAQTPNPPHFAVIFTFARADDNTGYAAKAEELTRFAASQPGYLGMEDIGAEFGATISYRQSLEAIQNWQQNERHLDAKRLGKSEWYQSYRTKICRVEHDYESTKSE